MSNVKEFNFDDFDYDEFNYDDPFDEPNNESKDRSPAMNVATGAFKGFKEAATDKNLHVNMLRKALPEGYAAAFDVVDDVTEKGSGLYNQITEDLRPAIYDLKRIGRRAKGMVDSILPDGVSKKLDEILAEEESYNRDMSKDEIRSQSIAHELAPIFEIQAEEKKEEKTEQMLDKVVESRRHKVNRDISEAILNELKRSNTYQDKITAQYQRKSLELKYRQYFVSKDHYELYKRATEEGTALLRSISKNTGLPDVVKMRNSELALQLTKERLIGKAQDKVAPLARDFLNSFSDNIGKRLKEKVDEFKDAVATASFAGDVLDNMDLDEAGVNKFDMAGQMAGNTLTRTAGEWIGKKLAPTLQSNDKIKGISNKLLYGSENYHKILKGYLEEQTFTNPILNMLQESALDALRLRRESKIGYDQLATSTDAAAFDNLTRKSIVEVMPGWLSKIYHVLSGKKEGEETFDHGSNSFVKTDDLVKHISNLATPELDLKRMSEINQTLMDKITGSDITDLSEQLETLFLKLAREDEVFDGKKLVNGDYRNKSGLSISDYDRFVESVSEKLNLDEEGKLANDNLEGTDAIVQANRKLRELRESMPNAYEVANLYANTANREAVRRTGLVENLNGEDHLKEDYLFERYKEYKKGGTNEENIESSNDASNSNTSYNRNYNNTTGTITGDDIDKFISSIEQLENSLKTSISSIKPNVTVNNSLGDLDLSSLAQYEQSNEQIKLLQSIKETLLEMPEKIKVYIGGSNPEDYDPNMSDSNWREDIKSRYRDTRDRFKGTLDGSVKDFFSVNYDRFIKNPFNWGKKQIIRGFTPLNKGMDFLNRQKNKFKDQLLNRDKIKDIFIKGSDLIRPKLEKAKLEAGEYRDAVTGKIITSLSDIKGAVKDAEGNIVLSYEDFKKGLVDGNGKEIVLNGIKKGFDFLKNKLNLPYMKGFKTLSGFSKKIHDKGFEILENLGDVYVKGEDVPRLKKVLIKQGFYINSSGKAVKRLQDINSEIKDRNGITVIYEQELSNLVDEEQKPLKGLASKILGKLGSVASTGWNLGKKGFDLLKKGSMGLVNQFSGLFSNIAEKLPKVIGFGSNERILKKIYNLLLGYFSHNGYESDDEVEDMSKFATGFKSAKETMSSKFEDLKTKTENFTKGRKFTDAKDKFNSFKTKTKDRFSKERFDKYKESFSKENIKTGFGGIKEKLKKKKEALEGREGSWLNRLKEQKEKAKQKATNVKDKIKEKAEKGKGLFGSITGLLGGAVGWLGKIFGGIKSLATVMATAVGGSSLLDSVGDMFGGGDGDRRSRRGGRAARAARGFGGRLLNGAKMGGRMLLGAGGMALRAAPAVIPAAASIGSAVIGGAATVAGTAASILFSPVVLGAVAVGTIGYFAYKWTVENMDLMTEMRMLQYGVGDLDYDKCSKIGALENLFKPYVIIGNDKAEISGKVPYEKILEIFEFDIKDKARTKAFNIWFMERFKPVYLTNVFLLNKMAKSKDLQKIDDLLEDDIKSEFAATSIIKTDPSPYSRTASPFKHEEQLDYGMGKIRTKLFEIKEEYGVAKPTSKANLNAGKSIAAARRKASDLNDTNQTSKDLSTVKNDTDLSVKEIDKQKDIILQKTSQLQIDKQIENSKYEPATLKEQSNDSSIDEKIIELRKHKQDVSEKEFYYPKNNTYGEIARTIQSVANHYDLPVPLMLELAKEVSGFNTNAREGSRQGLYLMDSATFSKMQSILKDKYGITDLDITNPVHSSLAAAESLKSSNKELTSALKREPDIQESFAAMMYGIKPIIDLINTKGNSKITDIVKAKTVSDMERLKTVKDKDQFFDEIFQRLRNNVTSMETNQRRTEQKIQTSTFNEYRENISDRRQKANNTLTYLEEHRKKMEEQHNLKKESIAAARQEQSLENSKNVVTLLQKANDQRNLTNDKLDKIIKLLEQRGISATREEVMEKYNKIEDRKNEQVNRASSSTNAVPFKTSRLDMSG